MSGSKASNSKTLLIVAQEVPMILRTNCLAIAKVIIRLQIYTHIHTHSNRLSNTFYIFDIDGGTILNESKASATCPIMLWIVAHDAPRLQLLRQ
jgi:hypothetical protein